MNPREKTALEHLGKKKVEWMNRRSKEIVFAHLDSDGEKAEELGCVMQGTWKFPWGPKPPPSAQNTDHKNDSPTAKNITNISGNNNNNNNDNESNLSSYNSQSSNSNDPNSDSAIYVELGEPTLCMHSEISNAANRNNNTSPSIQQQPSINHNNNVTNSNENNTGNTAPTLSSRHALWILSIRTFCIHGWVGLPGLFS